MHRRLSITRRPRIMVYFSGSSSPNRSGFSNFEEPLSRKCVVAGWRVSMRQRCYMLSRRLRVGAFAEASRWLAFVLAYVVAVGAAVVVAFGVAAGAAGSVRLPARPVSVPQWVVSPWSAVS